MIQKTLCRRKFPAYPRVHSCQSLTDAFAIAFAAERSHAEDRLSKSRRTALTAPVSRIAPVATAEGFGERLDQGQLRHQLAVGNRLDVAGLVPE